MHAFRQTFAAMALAALPALTQADTTRDIRTRIGELSGYPLSAAVTAAFAPDLTERYRAVFYTPYSELWLMDANAAGILDTGLVTLDSQQHGADVVVTWAGSGRTSRLPASVLLNLIRNEAPAPERVALASCHDRVRHGGVLGRDVGLLSAGQRIVGGTVIADNAMIGRISGNGGRISLLVGPGKAVIECSELQSALGKVNSPAEQLASELAVLLQTLEDGNAAMRQLADYQLQLRSLAISDPAAARDARLDPADCRVAATLAVICDRLVATFRHEQ